MRSTKMIVFALLNETGGCFLDPGLGLLVQHPLDQSPKRVGWNGFRKMGTRAPRENTFESPDGTPAVTKTTREAKCGHVSNFLVQRLTVHLGHMKVPQDEGKAAFRKQREGFVPVPG